MIFCNVQYLISIRIEHNHKKHRTFISTLIINYIIIACISSNDQILSVFYNMNITQYVHTFIDFFLQNRIRLKYFKTLQIA